MVLVLVLVAKVVLAVWAVLAVWVALAVSAVLVVLALVPVWAVWGMEEAPVLLDNLCSMSTSLNDPCCIALRYHCSHRNCSNLPTCPSNMLALPL